MTPELLPSNLGAAARALGIEPFELVRLWVASGGDGASMTFTTAQIEQLRTYGGIEVWWDDHRAVPTDEIPGRGVLRGVLQQLLKRGHVGDQRTRQDNLWRGLPARSRRLVEDAVDVLVEHGLVSVRSDAAGVQISARPEAVDRVTAIADGKDIPDDLARIWA